jgi:hypothetical protein
MGDERLSNHSGPLLHQIAHKWAPTFQTSEIKNPPRLGAAGLEPIREPGRSDGVRNSCFQVGHTNTLAFGLNHVRTALEHAIEFVDQHGDGFVALVGRY